VGKRFDTVTAQVHDEVLHSARRGMDRGLAEAVGRKRGVGDLDDEHRLAGVLVLPAFQRGGYDGEVRLGTLRRPARKEHCTRTMPRSPTRGTSSRVMRAMVDRRHGVSVAAASRPPPHL
jgi:hypothetical protein